jgi:hypothetical protein
MHRAVMREHAPAAVPVGIAGLADFRFVITADGYASVEPVRAQTVHGVLWRLSPRDRIALDIWENVASGLYRAEMLPVRWASQRHRALVYVARPSRNGRPKAGYLELVIAAARAWQFPPDYIAALREWLPARPGPAASKLNGLSWT